MKRSIYESVQEIPYDGMNHLMINGYKFIWNFVNHSWRQVSKFPEE